MFRRITLNGLSRSARAARDELRSYSLNSFPCSPPTGQSRCQLVGPRTPITAGTVRISTTISAGTSICGYTLTQAPRPSRNPPSCRRIDVLRLESPPALRATHTDTPDPAPRAGRIDTPTPEPQPPVPLSTSTCSSAANGASTAGHARARGGDQGTANIRAPARRD